MHRLVPACSRGPATASLRAVAAAAFLAAAGAQPVGAVQHPSAAQIAVSSGGVVVTAQPLATSAGARMLERGGNAADAAVAAAFALAVVESSMNSIGGRTQILLRLPDGTVRGIDATTQAPATYDPDRAPQASYGYATVGVPGAVAGLLRLHDEFGSLPLDVVMAPAIDYAENGVRLLAGEARRQAFAARQVAEFEGTRRVFLHDDGTPYRAGERLVQPDLARTLRAIRDGGRQAFYEGEIARRMAEDIQAHGGAVTLESLRDYRALDARIVRGRYRGYDLIGTYVPAAGAVSIEALQILEHFDLANLDGASWAAAVGQALALAVEDARSLMGPPEMAERLTSAEWAAERARLVRLPGASPEDGAGPASFLETPDDDGHTTHMTAADADGMVVALTQTIGPSMGSKVVTPGLGFLYAATLGGYLGRMEPGERARSFISPLLVEKDGEPVLVLGAAGGVRIVTAVVHTVARVIDQGMSLPDALAAPRVHPTANGIELETTPGVGWSPDVVRALREAGWEVREQPRVGAFGRVHAVYYDRPSKRWVGVADPDWEGTAAAVEPAAAGSGGGR
ncbi:MAG: hypothetical protein D6701_05830 [Gemmatimonadetes bacterium]|nr:MAG: hypothetical protein D6701_05830 [Gemmatimonadota bacterium]